MAKATITLSYHCQGKSCDASITITVVRTIAKGTPAVSLEDALTAAAIPVGFRRVHAIGEKASRILCGECCGDVECGRCGAPAAACGCIGGHRFDVQRAIKEGAGG